MAIAAQAGSIIPADIDGDPVYPMITWLDTRARNPSAYGRPTGPRPSSASGAAGSPSPVSPPSICWLRQNRPEIHSAARRFLGPADFLIHRLTGRFATDLSAASEMLLVDIKTGEWSEELCAWAAVDPATQSEIGWAGRKWG